MAKYKKLEKIDSGGFGCVYRARRVEDNEIVAFKELTGDTITEDDRLRFVREVRIQSRLEHPNIVPVLGSNLTVMPPFFVMPVAKSNLRGYLVDGILKGDLKRVLTLFFQTLDGIAFAHSSGVIHRDLKPENLLLFEDFFGEDWIRISDFGLGKRFDAESLTVTRSYVGMGTVPYMAPEQCHDLKHVDQRADIFSLGKILYELLTREFPLHVNTHSSDLPRGFGYIIGRCLEHSPENRYQTADELKQEIQLITSAQNKFEHPQRRVHELIRAVEDGHGDSASLIKEIDQVFQENATDEAFFTKYFVLMGSLCLESYISFSLSRFRERLEAFDEFVKGSLPFGYTDTVANFYKRVWAVTDHLEVRRLVLARLLAMGYEHNRWHVGKVFGALLQSIDSHDESLMARDILRHYPDAASWVRGYCGGGLLPIIKEGFPEDN